MCKQIDDTCWYEGQEFTVLKPSPAYCFRPGDFGLQAHARLTACWRGHWCVYEVAGDALFLRELYLFNAEGHYPPLNGVEVSPPEFETDPGPCAWYHSPQTTPMLAHFEHRVYRDVHLPLPYTGTLLLEPDERTMRRGDASFQRAWANRRQIELTFQEGLLLGCRNLSGTGEGHHEAAR